MHLQAELAALRSGSSDAEDSEGALSATLERSYARLKSAHIDMFMDVATALVGQPKEWALTVWEGWHGPKVAACYAELEARCLLSTDEDGRLQMHDVIRNVARGALLEGKYPRTGLRRWWSKVENKLMPQLQQVRGVLSALGGAHSPASADVHTANLPQGVLSALCMSRAVAGMSCPPPPRAHRSRTHSRARAEIPVAPLRM